MVLTCEQLNIMYVGHGLSSQFASSSHYMYTMIRHYLDDKLKHLSSFANLIEVKFTEQFGFPVKETSFENVVSYMYAPKDSSSLAVTRILFGALMLLDIPDERGGARLSRRWGAACGFPLLPALAPPTAPVMALVYAALWLGAAGMAVGYKYRISSATFTVCYWYLFLLEKSYWNNHSYLFGLVGFLLATTDAHCRWSMDVFLDSSKLKKTVPYWNYFLLKYQFFILYFVAGLKKGTAEWLTGYSVQRLSEHWVFAPFKLFLSVEQTDYLVVHWFIFWFDLSVAAWLMWRRSRAPAMLLCALFHLMNSRLFTIGMFPWVCLATMPLFCPFDWPLSLYSKIQELTAKVRNCVAKMGAKEIVVQDTTKANDSKALDHNNSTAEANEIKDEIAHKIEKSLENDDEDAAINKIIDDNSEKHRNVTTNANSRKFVVVLIGVYVFIQAFLPYSHFITQGYNNWTNGLYGYSWDMMVQTWDIDSVVVKVIDNRSRQELFIDPYAHTPNDRWTRHGDMVLQYAACVRDRLESAEYRYIESINVSVYIDVWCSLNGRFTQRMFDPTVDLLTVEWSPFRPIPFLLPLIDEGLHWRETLQRIREQVHAADDHSDVIFMADFPGFNQEKFVPVDLVNVTLTVLRGAVGVAAGGAGGQSRAHGTGDALHITPGTFHTVHNIGKEPAFYMYTYKNLTAANTPKENRVKPKLPIAAELSRRIKDLFVFGKIVASSISHLLFGTLLQYE